MKKTRPSLLQILLSLAVIGAGCAIYYLLVTTTGTVAIQPPIKPVTLVETIVVKRQGVPATVTAYGTVKAKRELTLTSEVTGRVISMSDDLLVGGLLTEGQTLIQIDPRDYEAIVEQEKAAVAKAQFELRVEEGRQIVAQREFELLRPSIPSTALGEELVLRRPHLMEKTAALKSAQSKLRKAEVDYERTTIRTPFQSVILSEQVEVGQILSTQTQIATLASTDEFWVQVSIPYKYLDWFDIPIEVGEQGSPATVIQELGQSKTLTWDGNVVGLLADVDPAGRMARILVAVEDPFGLDENQMREDPLLIGTYVRVELQGPLLPNSFIIPRKAVREGDRVWVKNKKNKLEIRHVEIALRMADTVIVQKGIYDQDEVVISSLPIAIQGMPLRSVLAADRGVEALP